MGYQTSVAGVSFESAIGAPLPHVVRLTIIPSRATTVSMWDGTYTDESWNTYENMYNSGDPNAASFLVQNMVDVEGYYVIDAKKITISGWEGIDTVIPQSSNDGGDFNICSTGGAWGASTIGIDHFRGTSFGNANLSDSTLNLPTTQNGLLNYEEQDWYGKKIGDYGVFIEVNGVSQTSVNTMRVFGDPSLNNNLKPWGDDASSGNYVTLNDEVAIGNADTNALDNWSSKIRKIILIDTLGVDENGIGLEGNMVHAYVMSVLGSTVDSGNSVAVSYTIDFDGDAEFVITDTDFEFTETELLTNQTEWFSNNPVP